MTLSDEKLRRAVEEGWISARHNQCPGLYCEKTADNSRPIPYSSGQLATVCEGAGGGNIRFYFCDSDGVVVRYVRGFIGADRFISEMKISAPGPQACVGRRVADVLRQIEDEIYTKGAIG